MAIKYNGYNYNPKGIVKVRYNGYDYFQAVSRKLAAPEIALDYTELTITDKDGRTEQYSIFVNGNLATTINFEPDVYPISETLFLIQGDADNVTQLAERTTATLKYTTSADTAIFRDTITVSGCDYIYNKKNDHEAEVAISNPTGNININIDGYGYDFIIQNEDIIGLKASKDYDRELIFPNEYNGQTITTISVALTSGKFDGITKIIFSDGITTVNTLPTFANVKSIIIPSSLINCSAGWLGGCTEIGKVGFVEYNYSTNIPSYGLSVKPTANSIINHYIKSSITNLDSNALKDNASNTVAYTDNIYFYQPSGVEVSFGSTVIKKGSSKATITYNIYTDNEDCKTAMQSYADQYTLVNMFHLDGTEWSE